MSKVSPALPPKNVPVQPSNADANDDLSGLTEEELAAMDVDKLKEGELIEKFIEEMFGRDCAYRVCADFRAMIGNSYRAFKKGEVILNYAVAQELLKAGLPIVEADADDHVVCPKCKHHFATKLK